MSELRSVDGAAAVFVEDAEGGAEFGFGVGVCDFVGHYCCEFWGGWLVGYAVEFCGIESRDFLRWYEERGGEGKYRQS